MQARDFVFWLQGLLEVGKIETLDADQVSTIKTHLDLVFRHDAGIKQAEMAHEASARNDSVDAVLSAFTAARSRPTLLC